MTLVAVLVAAWLAVTLESLSRQWLHLAPPAHGARWALAEARRRRQLGAVSTVARTTPEPEPVDLWWTNISPRPAWLDEPDTSICQAATGCPVCGKVPSPHVRHRPPSAEAYYCFGHKAPPVGDWPDPGDDLDRLLAEVSS